MGKAKVIDKGMLASAMSGKIMAGKSQLIKHLKGERLTQREAIKAKCYDCNGMGESNECDIEDCPIHPYSPYKLKAASASTTPETENNPTQEGK